MSAVVSRLSVFLVVIFAARLLPPEQFGLFATLGVVASLITALVSGGGDMWLNRFTTNDSGYARPVTTVWRSYLTICAVMAGSILVVAATFLAIAPLSGPVRQATTLMVIGGVAMGLAEAGFAVGRARGYVAAFFTVRDIFVPTIILIGIVAISPASAAGIFAIHGGFWAIVAAGLLFTIWRRTGQPISGAPSLATPTRGTLIRHTLSLQAGNLSHRVATHLDVLALTWIVALGAVGEYRVAAQFAIGFAIVQHFVFLGLPWQLRQTSGESRVEGFAEVRQRQNWLIILSTAALVVGWLIAEPFLAFVAPRFADSAWLFRLLMLIRFADLLWGPQHEVLISNGLARRDVFANIIAIAAWAMSFAILGSIAPTIAAAVGATAIAAATGQFARHCYIRAAGLQPVAGVAPGVVLPLVISTATVLMATTILP